MRELGVSASGRATRVPMPLWAETISLGALDWPQLVGAHVEVMQRGRIIHAGVVEDATPDGTIVWIAQHGLERRRLIHKAEGYELRPAPQEIYDVQRVHP